MLKALAWKECRDLLPVAALALLVQFYLVFTGTGIDTGILAFLRIGQPTNAIPFATDSVSHLFFFVAGAAAVGLGLWQTMLESSRGTFQFLLHRPIRRETILASKLVVGVLLCLAIAAIPTLLFALWAATPDTHASPFEWSMTSWAWQLCLQMTLIYLGAFLSGLRPGKWFGSRFLPLAASSATVFFLSMLGVQAPIAVPLCVLLDICLFVVILDVAASRDFS